jgi:secondary thiamine-phosphate synthase enzyme
VPHTTAAVTINEGFDPDVAADVVDVLARLVPRDDGYAHLEGNSDSHVKSIMVGCSQLLGVAGGTPVLGRWQRIFFCEFDGPRQRQLLVLRV